MNVSGIGRTVHTPLRSPAEIESMRVAGRLAGEVLKVVAAHVKPGVTTAALGVVCTSVNNVIHDIPSVEP